MMVTWCIVELGFVGHMAPRRLAAADGPGQDPVPDGTMSPPEPAPVYPYGQRNGSCTQVGHRERRERSRKKRCSLIQPSIRAADRE